MLSFNPSIKTIVFDLGNVIIDLDIERTWSSLKHHLGDNFFEKMSKIYPNRDIFIDFEIGIISEKTFFDTLQSAAEGPLSIRALMEAWNAMLLTINPKRFKMLAQLKTKYNVFLLSNTNETHVNFVDGYLQTVYGFSIKEFDARYFHRVYYSHLIHLRKPNVNIYDFVINDAQIEPAETLFVDDNADNIKGVLAAGWHGYLHRIGDEIVDIMQPYL
jgi:glucose-1-phosphatase